VTDETTAAEVARELATWRQDVRDDFREVRDLIGATARNAVAADVYRSDQQLTAERLQVMRADLDRMDKDHADERAAAQRWRDRLDDRRKWIIAGVILPIGGLLVEIIFALKGGK
jgi:hypothetical protein